MIRSTLTVANQVINDFATVAPNDQRGLMLGFFDIPNMVMAASSLKHLQALDG
jgi:hypothetical protein